MKWCHPSVIDALPKWSSSVVWRVVTPTPSMYRMPVALMKVAKRQVPASFAGQYSHPSYVQAPFAGNEADWVDQRSEYCTSFVIVARPSKNATAVVLSPSAHHFAMFVFPS